MTEFACGHGGASADRVRDLLKELGVGDAMKAIHETIGEVPGSDARLSAAVVMLTVQLVETQSRLGGEVAELREQLAGVERAVTGLGVRWDDVHYTMEARSAELARKTGNACAAHCATDTRAASERLRSADAARILCEREA